MRRPILAGTSNPVMNMTPMIDVVFLLIVFFLVSSHLARQETQVDVQLPEATTGQRSTEDSPFRRVVINVTYSPDGRGQILIAGQPVLVNKLPMVLEAEKAQATELEVRIRCDRRVPYRDVEPILVACARSGIWNISFSVVEK